MQEKQWSWKLQYNSGGYVSVYVVSWENLHCFQAMIHFYDFTAWKAKLQVHNIICQHSFVWKLHFISTASCVSSYRLPKEWDILCTYLNPHPSHLLISALLNTFLESKCKFYAWTDNSVNKSTIWQPNC